jgi:hypothetical protein
MLERPKTIHVGVDDWLVLDVIAEPRFLIHYGPAVHKVTGETLMRYRVDHFVLERAKRWPLGFYDTLAEATDAAVGELTRVREPRPQDGDPRRR